MALLEDAAELATTAAAGAVFAYLEAGAAWLRRAIGAHTAARYSTLRICNNILRRLSKATAASLCGCAPQALPRPAPHGAPFCAHFAATRAACSRILARLALWMCGVRAWCSVHADRHGPPAAVHF